MNPSEEAPDPGRIEVIYDDVQHCTARKESAGKAVAMDCPYTGKGVELSPTNLVEAALGGCILMAMGAVAVRNNIDMKNARIDVNIGMAEATPARFGQVDITVRMPRQLEPKDRTRLERAADACPIKHSLLEDIPVSVTFAYPE
jgi:putative redox protein